MAEKKIALIADTHIRPRSEDGQFAFPSDHLHNDRARKAVAAINQLQPDLIIHMGDVVHPLPHQSSHTEAIEIAQKIFSDFRAPFYVLPGNHDIGDKSGTANAPEVDSDSRSSFTDHWGALYQTIEVADALLILLDSVLLCSKDNREQRLWLLSKVEESNKRIYIFSHFPPYIFEPNEEEHYDNYDRESRRWFLELISIPKVEAVFSAHVHRFFYNHHKDTDLYTVPATSFIRPEYAGLQNVSPADSENGRNDIEQLGITVLTLTGEGHRLDIKKIYSDYSEQPTKNKPNLGIWLHRKLGVAMDIPYSDLDILRRKTARYDHSLIHIVNLGISRIRIPLSDLADKAVLDRLHWLKRQGINLTVFSAGLPSEPASHMLRDSGLDVEWEWVLRENDYTSFSDTMNEWQGEKGIISRIGKSIRSSDRYHSHFPRIGFEAEDPAIFNLALNCDSINGIAYRIADHLELKEELKLIIEHSLGLEKNIHCHIELPYNSEAKAQTDDSLVNARCLEITKVIHKYPDITFYIDILEDKDRGYWCRHGLVDRNDKARMGYGIIKSA